MNVLTKNYMKFVENISLTDSQITQALKDADEVSEFIRTIFPDAQCQIIGSFAKNTQTTPKIDVAVTLGESELKRCLSEKYSTADGLAIDFDESMVNIIPSKDGKILISGRWVENTTDEDIEKITASEVEDMHNTHHMVKIIKYWRDYQNVSMNSYFIERETVDFYTNVYYGSDSYLLLGFMILKFMEYLIANHDEAWAEDLRAAHELVDNAVKMENPAESIRCFREVFGEAFPDTEYEHTYGEYVM